MMIIPYCLIAVSFGYALCIYKGLFCDTCHGVGIKVNLVLQERD